MNTDIEQRIGAVLRTRRRAVGMVNLVADRIGEVASRVVFMHERRVHEIGPPTELFADPKTPELRRFLGVAHQ